MGETHTDGDAAQLSSFQRDALRVIALCMADDDAEEPYGLGIKRALSDWYGEEVNHGRLYPNLDTLVESGLVTKQELDKRTNAYRLTDDGADVLQDLKHRYTDAYNRQEGGQ